jgi:tetratricopeptide (TPR) repeat protein
MSEQNPLPKVADDLTLGSERERVGNDSLLRSYDAQTVLPKQEYDSEGRKVPYVRQPNPYTEQAAVIPPRAQTLFLAAKYKLRTEDLKGARLTFEQITKEFPQLSGPWVKLGVIAETREKYEEAIRCYNKAISVNAANVNAYLALALLERKQGNFAAAQATYVAALQAWKDFPEAHLNLAILYDLYLNRPQQAQQHYEAYYFLSGSDDQKVKKWLIEVKRRTGIQKSFVDNPPNEVAGAPDEKGDEPGAESAPDGAV